ncbi:MAG: twin-arginine translocase subunit TatC [Planctomycetota bacterium]
MTTRAESGLKTMSFGEHLEELRYRVLRSVLAVTLGFLVALAFQGALLRVMTRPHRLAMQSLARQQEAVRLLRDVEALRELLDGISDRQGVDLAAVAMERRRKNLEYRDTLRRLQGRLPAGVGDDLARLLNDLLRSAGLVEDQLDPLHQLETAVATLRAGIDQATPTAGDVGDALPAVQAVLAAMGGRLEAWSQAGSKAESSTPAKPLPPAEDVTAADPTHAAILQRVSRGLAEAADRIAQWRTSVGEDTPLRLLKYTDSFFAHIKVAFLAGLTIGLPWFTLELWAFIAAGLYPHERRSVFPFIPLSLTFLVLGGLFAFFVLTPIGLTYLGGYGSRQVVEMSFTLNDYLSLVITMILGMAVVFQLPLVMVFLSRAGWVEVAVFRRYRRYSILGALVIGAILTPPDVVTQLLMAGPLVILYETGIWACQFFAPRRRTADGI